VNPYLAVCALVFVVSSMLLLPLVPGFVELHRKSDALPLNVIQQHAGEIRHFANSFRAYVKPLEPTLQQCVASGTNASGAMPDGEEYVVLGRTDQPLLVALQERDAMHPVVIAAGADMVMPPQATFSKDIYAGGRFFGGEKNNYRAILGEKEVHLGGSSSVMRWVHAVGEFTADLGCRLYGRVSSDTVIRLHADCNFLRLNAPRIEIGQVSDNEAPIPPNSTLPANLGTGASRRFLHDGDFEIQAGEVVKGNLVIRGKLRMRSGSRVCGSVKSDDDMILENGVSVEGSLISARQMRIGPNCAVHGPVIAEHGLAIGPGTHCGSAANPTTVSAPRIEVEQGVVVFGTLWAREYGQVVDNA
jgi:cytoskeletal protein CcmA (bactofilin family)